MNTKSVCQGTVLNITSRHFTEGASALHIFDGVWNMSRFFPPTATYSVIKAPQNILN